MSKKSMNLQIAEAYRIGYSKGFSDDFDAGRISGERCLPKRRKTTREEVITN